MTMEKLKILDQITFELDIDKLFLLLRLERDHPFAEELISFAEQAASKIQPKAVFTRCEIEQRGEDFVAFGGQVFHSRILALNLKDVNEVFPYIATCGIEADSCDADDDILKKYWLDVIKELALEKALDYLFERIKSEHNFVQLPSMSPGSGTADIWPLEQQKNLFAIFGNVEQLIGVRLTDSCLMIPNKSVSGICFSRGQEFITCQLCPRENCSKRRAAYNPHIKRQFSESTCD